MNGIFDKTLSTVFKIDNQDTENTENVSDNKNVDNVVNDTVDKVSDKVGTVNNKLRSFVQNKKHLT